MKNTFLFIGTALVLGFSACNDSGDKTTTTSSDSTTNTSSGQGSISRGTEIANFSSRSFMDVKSNQPVNLRWDTTRYYYVDESGNQANFYYDPATMDTFDYWGRRVNNYLIYDNNDYRVDEARIPAIDVTVSGDTSTMNTSGDTKVKMTDDKYKEKTDTSKLKITDDKMKTKDK